MIRIIIILPIDGQIAMIGILVVKQIGNGIRHIMTTEEILIATVAISINSIDTINDVQTLTAIIPDM